MCNQELQSDFHSLDPDLILRLAEEALGNPMSGLCRPYASYINRVYEIQTKGRR